MKCSKCSLPVSNKKHGLCVVHEWERKHPGQKYTLRTAPIKWNGKPDTSPRTRIKKVSEKMNSRLVVYRNIRKQYLDSHVCCEVLGCYNPATDIHHKKGRENDLLVDTRYFMAICRLCHARIDTDPEWARSNGYTLRRF